MGEATSDAASIPNPGSPEAVALGCRCPRADNNHGRGAYGLPRVFVRVQTCPLHGWPEEARRA